MKRDAWDILLPLAAFVIALGLFLLCIAGAYAMVHPASACLCVDSAAVTGSEGDVTNL